ncbi:MAG: hypothetical protein Q9220_002564 [cf. Caloplaca sp. 1 TL-2023]
MASQERRPREISGYWIFPLSLPPLPSFPVHATHYLYLRPHEPKLPTPTAARSLFLVNVPFDSTDSHIKNLLSVQIGLPQGRVEEVQFEGVKKKNHGLDTITAKSVIEKRGKKRKRQHEEGNIEELEGTALPDIWDRSLQVHGLTAVVVFVDRPSMEAAVRAVKAKCNDDCAPVWGEGLDGKVPALGSARYLNHHKLQYPDKDELLASVNKFMTEFAVREASQARMQIRKRQVPDDEGFVTVTKGGRTGPARQEAAQELAFKQKEKQKGLDNFYRFQTREKKKAQAAELAKKFEEDKEKIRKMKERRSSFKACDPLDMTIEGFANFFEA